MLFNKTIVLIFIICSVVSSFNSEKVYAGSDKQTFDFVTTANESTLIDVTLYTLFKRLGYEITVTSVGMSTGLQMVNSGEKDGIVAQADYFDEEMYKYLVKVPESISSISVFPIVRDDFEHTIFSWDDLKDYNIGYLYQQPHIEEHLSEKIKYHIKKDSYDELYKLLESNVIDIILMEIPENTGENLPVGLKFLDVIETTPTYTYINRQYAHLVHDVAYALSQMKKDGTFEDIVNNSQSNRKDNSLILNITSFYPDMIWESNLKQGLKSVFPDSDKSYINYTVSLNSKKILSDENRKKSIYDTIRANFMSRRPDLLIVSDIYALNFTIDNYYTMFKNIPVVFCGVNNISPKLLSKMNENFTGIKEHVSAKETVSLILSLFPDTKKIFVINDYLDKGSMWREDIDEQLQPLSNTISIEHNENTSIDQLIQHVRNLPKDTVILSGFYFTDSNNSYFSQKELQMLLVENASVPIFGLLNIGFGYGQVGGKYVDSFTEQLKAANIAKGILTGKSVLEVPIRYDDSERNIWSFDYNVLKKYDINEGMLPQDAVIINKALPIYKSHPNETLFVVIGAIVITIAILILSYFATTLKRQNHKLLEMQKDLHSAEELIAKDAEIKEIKEHLEKIISTAPVFYMFVVDGVVVEINDYVKRHIGIDINDTVDNLYTNPLLRIEVNRRLKNKPLLELKSEKLNMKDGKVRRFHLSIAKYMFKNKTALILWGIDVEEIEVQKDIINKSQKELKILIDGLPMAICFVNTNSKNIVYANNSFFGMFKYNDLHDAVRFDVSALLNCFRESNIDESHIVTSELQFYAADESVINTMVVTSLIQYNDETCYVSVFTDIAEEKKRSELLLIAAEKEKEANYLKSRFLVNMSHEIRTPMNAIIGLSQLALMKQQTRENNEVFRKIHVSSKSLLSIINDILDFSKIEAGKMELVEDDFNLEDIVANSFMVASERIENKKIEMLLNMSPDVNFNLIGDKTRLWQILKNVLDNSAKYTMEGRIILTVSNAKNISGDDKVYLSFVAEDTGLGMSEEQVNRLFSPFEQFHNKGSSINTGTGLGMSILKQLIDLMGGKIEIHSEVNIGTVIKMVLPFRQQNNRKTMKHILQEDRLEKRRVLIADDDNSACEIMKNLLEIAGISPVCVNTGDDAINVVNENNKNGTPFDIIILDYMLGNDNGVEVAKKINELTSVKSKLLMVSAYSKQLISKDIKAVGFSDIIEKPFVPSYFMHQLNSSMANEHYASVLNYEKFYGARVLLCEDNALNQEVAIGMMESFGIVPDIAGNGVECLAMLEQNQYDLIFMDILMPIKDGRQTTSQIRNSSKPYRDIPIIAMTANVMKDDIKEYFSEGMNGHIGKPLVFDDIYKQLNQFLSKGKGTKLPPQSVKEEAEVEHTEEIDEIKAEEGIRRFGGKKERYVKVLLKFAQELEQDIMPFEEAVSEKNKDETTIIIHTLKGVAGNLGIERLFVATQEFEMTLREGNPNPVLYMQISEERKRAHKEIKRRFTLETAISNAKTTGTEEEFIHIVRDMREALDNSDPLTCERLLASLKSKNWTKMTNAEVVELEGHISGYNFYNAELILEKYN